MICPTCKRAFTVPAAGAPPAEAKERPPLPFCSPRCRAADLGNWLSGNYRIVTPASEDELDSGPDTDGETSSSVN
jgi:endogenous inhibitor of DNA gyrase (YacG/DUF329 family)